MPPAEILAELRRLVAQAKVELLPLAAEPAALPRYAPAEKYLRDLLVGSKPKAAAEELFAALCRDVLRREPVRQVIVREGWVDFRLTDPSGRVIPVELKALFQRDGHDRLRAAWLCSTRDCFIEEKPFAALPFADLFECCPEARSATDAIRRLEDTVEKPDLEDQFFEDLKDWFGEFEKVHWQPPERASEFIILLLNKLIFAKTLEDFGLVPYRYIQDEYARQREIAGKPRAPPRSPATSSPTSRTSLTSTTTRKSSPPASLTGSCPTTPTTHASAASSSSSSASTPGTPPWVAAW